MNDLLPIASKSALSRPTGAIAWGRLPPVEGEVELTLAATPADSGAVGRLSGNCNETARGAGRTKRLDSVYFDTADRVFHARGIGLRVRRIGRRWVQTLKTENPGDPMHRGEWEVELPSSKPDLDAFQSVAALALVEGVDPADLNPVLKTQISRRTRVLNIPGDPDAGHGPAVVEVAFDTGMIEAGGTMLPVAEMELELVRGDPAALYALGLALTRHASLRLETMSKAARGWGLVDATPPSWHKAARPAVPSGSVDAAMAGIFRDCYAHALANYATALDGREPEGVHQVRVALRRTRSALAVFRDILPDERRRHLDGEVKWLAGELGDARDWDVFRHDLIEPLSRKPDERVFMAPLLDAATAAQEAGRERARVALRSPRTTRLLLTLGGWLESRGWRREAPVDGGDLLEKPIEALADRLLNKTHRKVLRTGEGFAGQSDPERHEVRIKLKRLRYLSEFFVNLFDPRAGRRFVKALSRLQDGLGAFNDVAVARERLGQLRESHGSDLAGPIGMVLGWHGRAVADHDKTLIADWREFAAAKPYWRS